MTNRFPPTQGICSLSVAAVVFGHSAWVLSASNIVYSALSLGGVFSVGGGLYLMLQRHFVACAAQVPWSTGSAGQPCLILCCDHAEINKKEGMGRTSEVIYFASASLRRVFASPLPVACCCGVSMRPTQRHGRCLAVRRE